MSAPLRVMIQYSPGGSSTVRAGWVRALRSAGIDARFWRPDQKSAFDAFSEFEPGIFIGTTYDLDDAVEKCVRARPDLKVALFASAWGPLADALPPDDFPIVRVTDGEKKRLGRLREETGAPHVVFLHATGPYLEGSLGGWREIGVEPMGLLNAVDVCVYRPGKFLPHLAADFMFCGGFWPYKARKLDPYIFPLLDDLNGKIFGYSTWPTPYYLGRLDGPADECDAFASATVCLNVSEPHSTHPDYGADVIERVYKTLAVGAFVVSDDVPEMDLIFTPGSLVRRKTPVEFHEAVRHYARRPEERIPFMAEGRRCVLGSHCYHHRMNSLLLRLGFEKEAGECVRALAKFVG